MGFVGSPDVGHSVEGPIPQVNPGEIHAFRRHELHLFIQIQICRGEAYGAAHLAPVHDFPFEGIVVAQEGGCGGHVAGKQGLTNLGRAHGYTYARNFVRTDNVQTKLGGDVRRLSRGSGIVPYAVVVAEQNGGSVETLLHILAKVIGSGGAGELFRERQHFHTVHTETSKQIYLFVQGVQQTKRKGVVVKHDTGMRPEGDHHAQLAALARGLNQRFKHQAVPHVHTVEKSCCYYSHFTSGKS